MMENSGDELQHAMDQAKNAPNSQNYQHLIKKLQEKLNENLAPPITSHHDNEASFHPNHKHHEDHTEESKSLKSDTIVLVGSLIVMILIGMIFHQIISYLAKLRSRRKQYQRGLKQFGDHMSVVTRTISNPPSANVTPSGTPSIALRRLAAHNNNNNRIQSKKVTMVAVPDDDNSVFKPSTHVMRRDDSTLGTMTTATELRHHEKLHEHQEEDETS